MSPPRQSPCIEIPGGRRESAGMHLHRLAPAALILVATTAGAGPLTIRVYDMTGDGASRGTAIASATAALASAGLAATWSDGGDRPSPQDLVIRLVRRATPERRPGTLALGYALVDTAGRQGTVATIFLERVEWLAAAAGTPADDLLGLAIAHEVGHLLLGTTHHARRGLMRAEWTAGELRARRPADWAFPPTEGSALRSGLARRLGTGPGVADGRTAARATPGHDPRAAG